eukprot:4073326-Prymnesium_polylepis.3
MPSPAPGSTRGTTCAAHSSGWCPASRKCRGLGRLSHQGWEHRLDSKDVNPTALARVPPAYCRTRRRCRTPSGRMSAGPAVAAASAARGATVASAAGSSADRCTRRFVRTSRCLRAVCAGEDANAQSAWRMLSVKQWRAEQSGTVIGVEAI